MLGNGPKTCRTCGTTYEFALGNFYRDKSSKDGMHTQCIECKTRGKRSSRIKPLKSLDVEYVGKKTTRRKSYSKGNTLETFYDKKKTTPIKKKVSTTVAPQQRKLFDAPKKNNKKGSSKKHRCAKCQKTFPLTSEFFHRNRETQTGFRRECKACSIKHKKQYRANNKETEMFIQKRSNAALSGVEFTLDQDKWVQLMKETNTCGDCNGTMTCTAEKRNERTSFDKIDPTKGYLENNTRLICIKCNSQKNDLSPEEWNAVLEVRERKGIIEKVDSGIVEYVRQQDTLDGFFNNERSVRGE